MFRWTTKSESTYYRDLFVADKTMSIKNENQELDYYSFRYLGSELFMYKILDTNFVNYIESRGDVKTLPEIIMPLGASS